MANENEPTKNDPAQESKEPDYKAMYEQAIAASRKWESRAKANKEKADKWDAASTGGVSVEERIAKLEKENEDMRTSAARRDLVAKVAAETGLSESIVGALNGSDEDSLIEQAKAIADLKPKGAPSAPEAGVFPRGQETKTAAEQFSSLIDEMLS